MQYSTSTKRKMIIPLNSMRPPLADAGPFHLNFRRHLLWCLIVVLLASELDQLVRRRLDSPDNNEEAATSGDGLASHRAGRFMRVKLAKAAEVYAASQPNLEATWDSRFNQRQPQSPPPMSGFNLQLDAPLSPASQQHQAKQTAGQRLNDDTDDEFNLVEFLVSYVDRWLPTINLNYTLNTAKRFPAAQLDLDVENYYEERFPANMTLDQLQLFAVKAALRVAPLPLGTSWGYESRDELRLSSLPVQDDHRCAAHLTQLSQRLDRIMSAVQTPIDMSQLAARHPATPVENLEAHQLYKSQDLPMLRYLDTFGRVPSDLLRGNVKWYGSYDGCLDTKLKANPALGGTKRMKFRYCLGSIKSSSWKSTMATNRQEEEQSYSLGSHDLDAKMDHYFLRVGLCLPEACDSSALEFGKENGQVIEKLVKFNLQKPFNSDHYHLSELYCLPDLRSPLRTIPVLGKLLILATLGWLGLIGLATGVHLNVERFYRQAVREIRRKQKMDQLTRNYERNGTANESDEETRMAISAAAMKERELDGEHQRNQYKESDVLRVKQNWIRLNVWVWDKLTGGPASLIRGVDFVQCLSLYSNWLKYTNKLKLAVAQLHADEQRRERIKLRNLQLIERVRQKKSVAFATPSGSALNVNAAAAASSASSQLRKSASSGSNLNNGTTPTNNFDFDRELNRRLVVKDELDEIESDTLKKRVDTTSLNALKVIALFWIIAGHCIFYLVGAIENGALLKKYVRDLAAFALANGAMYITELFFVITGCLTAYLAFKYNTYKLPAEEAAELDEAESSESTKLNRVSRSGDSSPKRADANRPAAAAAAVPRASVSTNSSDAPAANETAYLEARLFRMPFWLMIIVNRYLRILPTYLAVYAWVKLISVYLGGEGPTWDYGVSANSMRRACAQESWLPVLTLTTNFIDIYKHCIIGGWYLSVDMQFMLMAAPLLVLLATCQRRGGGGGGSSSGSSSLALPAIGLNLKNQTQVSYSQKQQQLTFVNSQTNSPSASPDVLVADASATTTTTTDTRCHKNPIKIDKRLLGGYLVIVLLALASGSLAIIYGIFMSQLDLGYVLKFVPHAVAILSKNIAMYTNSVFRFRAFAFGLILGHLLYLHEFKLVKLPKVIQQHGCKITTIVASVGFVAMFMPVFYPKEKLILSHDITAVLMILTAGSVDLVLSVLIFLVCIGKAPKAVLFFLNSPFWSVLSSLSLCAFLVHTEIIILLTSKLMPLPSVQYSVLLFMFCTTLILTYSLAVALHLTFEMPISRLLEAIMRKYVSKSRLVSGTRRTSGAGETSTSASQHHHHQQQRNNNTNLGAQTAS